MSQWYTQPQIICWGMGTRLPALFPKLDASACVILSVRLSAELLKILWVNVHGIFGTGLSTGI